MSKAPEIYACLYAKEFAAQAMLRLRPEYRERAVAIVEGEPPLQVVCAFNARARNMGIARGMTRVELDTFPNCVILVRSAGEEAGAKAVLLQCASGFSPRIEDRSDSNSFLCVIDIAGTDLLFGTPQSLATKLLNRARAMGFAVSIAVSKNFHAAICQVKGSGKAVTVIAPGVESTAMSKLPLSVLNLPVTHAETFSLWGIRTLGSLATLPERELIARMGQEGKRLRQLALGEMPHHFVPVEPEFTLMEQMELEASVELLDSLLFVLSIMLEQLILRATERVLALAAVTAWLSLDGGGSHERTVRPALPTNDRKVWLKLIHLDLEANPPQAAILALALEAEPGHTSKMQLGLFSPQIPEASRLDVTLARIRSIVGNDGVGQIKLKDSHRPESFSVESFAVPNRSETVLAPQRPIAARRQLRPPESIAVTFQGTQPAAFTFRQKRYLVEHAYGPWMESGDWWNPTLWAIEQWDLIARSGEGNPLCCCLMRDPSQHAWQMVALYD